MNIIKYRVEERTIDVNAAPDRDGLMNATTGRDRVLTANDPITGWDLFRQQLACNHGRYASGKGRRLVLVEGGGDR